MKKHFTEGFKLHRYSTKRQKNNYLCFTNLKPIIKAQNKKVISVLSPTDKPCNCRNGTQCPFNGQCSQKELYKATTSHKNLTKEYVGSGGLSLKTRYNLHKLSLKPNESTKTTLSSYTKNHNFNHTNI